MKVTKIVLMNDSGERQDQVDVDGLSKEEAYEVMDEVRESIRKKKR